MRLRVGILCLRMTCLSPLKPTAELGVLALGLVLVFCGFAAAGSFLAFGPTQYVRDNGKPGPVVQTFSILDPSTTYTLRIDSNGVSRAIVSLTGVAIFTERDFNQRVTLLTKTVTLRATNQLSVELRGKPGESLTIQITGADNTPPTITASPDRPPNAAGWYNASVA